MPRFLVRSQLLAVNLILVASSVYLLADELPTARLVDGRTIRGAITQIDAQWNVTLDDGQRQHAVAADELVHWGSLRDREGMQQVVLADGSVLNADTVSLSRDDVQVESKFWQATKLPIELVRGVVLRPSADVLERDKLIFEMASSKGVQSRLLLENGDRLDGAIVYDRAEGEDPGASIHLETTSGGVVVPIEKVIAVVFNPSLVDRPTQRDFRIQVGCLDGSSLFVTQAAADSRTLSVGLIGGVQLKSTARGTPWELLTELRPENPRVVYLSDLDELSYKHIPFLEQPWPLQRDRSALGGRLRYGDTIIGKGLGMHSRFILAFSLDGEYQRFEAELAIDKLAGQRGSVVCGIKVSDESGQKKTVYESQVIRGGARPVPISIDVRGVKRIAIIVDFADHGDQWDHLNWLNARLVK